MNNFEWLDKEIEDLSFQVSDSNMFIVGKHAEAVIIRAYIRKQVEKEEDLKGLICDRYCKFPEAYDHGQKDDEERLHEERCNNCPLNRI